MYKIAPTSGRTTNRTSRWILIRFRQSSRSSSLCPSLLPARHPVTSSAAEVDIRSPRFDVGYVIRRSEYAPSGSEREERAGCRAGKCMGKTEEEGREGYSNGPTLVWKCARCKDDGGIRAPSRGYYQSLARQASHDNASRGHPP